MNHPFERILVGLDLTPMDDALLAYLRLFSQGDGAARVFFLHVSYASQLPVMAGGRYTRPQPDFTPDASLLEALKDELRSRLDLDAYAGTIEVIEGTISRQMLAYSEKHRVELTILGKKKISLGSGVAARRFLRSTTSSVLFVTEDAPRQIGHVVLACDFSDDSVLAMEKTLQWARTQAEPPRITLLNVYDVPPDMAARLSRTQGQYAHIIRENVESFVPVFLEQFDTTGLHIEPLLIENTKNNAARHIVDTATDLQADLLVLGARGHSSLSSLFLGSVTERVLTYNEQVPTLVVRPELV
ncbi:MAG: hypothetical protein OHK0039_48520 [Bacteroidia bacterium]